MRTHARPALARFLARPEALPMLLVLVLAAMLLAACGTAGPSAGSSSGDDPAAGSTARPATPGPMPTAVPAAEGEVTGTGTVLDRGRPELCLGGVLQSLPPQCDGPPITNWDWAAVGAGSFDEAAGVRWGDYTLTGTFDGTSFTLTQAPSTDVAAPAPEPDLLATPCPEPDGGWAVLDESRTTNESMEATFRRATRLDGYAGAWMDQSRNPHDPEREPERMNDPRWTTINVAVAGDPAAAETQLREVWGGALCVSRARHTERELRSIQERLMGLPGAHGASSGQDRVEVDVLHDDGSLQAWVDAEYGAGLVRVRSALR